MKQAICLIHNRYKVLVQHSKSFSLVTNLTMGSLKRAAIFNSEDRRSLVYSTVSEGETSLRSLRFPFSRFLPCHATQPRSWGPKRRGPWERCCTQRSSPTSFEEECCVTRQIRLRGRLRKIRICSRFQQHVCCLLLKDQWRPSFQRIVETVVLHWWESYTVNTKIWFYQLIC